jgi:uracil-DNA glycosylase
VQDSKSREDEMAALYDGYAQEIVLREVSEGKRLVRGHGPLDAPLVIVGEAPGADEDRVGRPFVGKSGQLLQAMFAQAGIPWDVCYVTNVLPWRPPGNRTPYPFEIAASAMRVREEIGIVDPVIVVAAGSVAWRALGKAGVTRFEEARWKWHETDARRRLLAVPHPAALFHLAPSDRVKWETATVEALKSALRPA